jgi:acetyl-CoA acetyltransferase
MNEIDKYTRVNTCSTLDELADVILSFADENGQIKGRTRNFNAQVMADICRRYTAVEHNMLTREYGIRQQALYILFYDNKIN